MSERIPLSWGAYLVIVLLLIFGSSCEPQSVAWNPAADKAAIVCRQEMDGVQVSLLYVAEVENRNLLLAVAPSALLDSTQSEGEFISAVAWSPDGRFVAYYKLTVATECLGKERAYDPRLPCSEQPMGAEGPATNDSTKPSAAKGLESLVGSFTTTKTDEIATTDSHRSIYIYSNGQRGSFQNKESESSANATVEAKLVVTSLDSKEKKVLKRFLWRSRTDIWNERLRGGWRPTWSADSKRVFYGRPLSREEFYLESVSVDGSSEKRHILSSTVVAQISANGAWIGTVYEQTISLVHKETGEQRHIDLGYHVAPSEVAWDRYLKEVAFAMGKSIIIVDLDTKESSVIMDEEADRVIGVAFDSAGDHVYYAKSRHAAEGTSGVVTFTVNSVGVDGTDKKSLLAIPAGHILSRFCVSPDSRFILALSSQRIDGGPGPTFVTVLDTRKSETLTVQLTQQARE